MQGFKVSRVLLFRVLRFYSLGFRVWFWVIRFRVWVIGFRTFTILGLRFRDFGFMV